MTVPSKNFTSIADASIDADSPLDVTLMTAIRDSLIHLEEWLGMSYTAAQNHDHDGANSKVVGVVGTPTAGDWITFENNTLRQRWPNTYDKVKEIKMGAAGVYRIKFTLKQSGVGGGHTVYGRIYVNGSAVGTERSRTDTTATVYSEDITTSAAGDLIQIYSKSSANSNTADTQSDISNMIVGVASPIMHGTLYGY